MELIRAILSNPLVILVPIAALIVLSWCLITMLAAERTLRENQPRFVNRLNTPSFTRKKNFSTDNNEYAKRIAAAGITMPYQNWRLIRICSTIAAAIIGFAVAGVFAMVVLAVGAFFAFELFLRMKENKNVELFEKQLSNAELQIAENFRAGLTVERAIQAVSSSVDQPLRGEFERVYNEVAFANIELPQALENMAERTNSSDVRLLASVIAVQKETGSDLADSLNFLAETINRRTEMRNTIKSELAQSNLTIKFVAIAPIAVFLFFILVNEQYSSFYLTTSAGWGVIAGVIIIEIIGLVILRRMAKVDFE